MLITWISIKWNRKCGRLLLWSSSHSKFYMDFGVEMFNKVILTYFTPLSSCGNSLTLLKSSILDCKFVKIASINRVLGGSESVTWYAYWYPLLLSRCWWTDFFGSLGSSCTNKKHQPIVQEPISHFISHPSQSKLLKTGWIEIYSFYQVTSIRFPYVSKKQRLLQSWFETTSIVMKNNTRCFKSALR